MYARCGYAPEVQSAEPLDFVRSGRVAAPAGRHAEDEQQTPDSGAERTETAYAGRHRIDLDPMYVVQVGQVVSLTEATR